MQGLSRIRWQVALCVGAMPAPSQTLTESKMFCAFTSHATSDAFTSNTHSFIIAEPVSTHRRKITFVSLFTSSARYGMRRSVQSQADNRQRLTMRCSERLRPSRSLLHHPAAFAHHARQAARPPPPSLSLGSLGVLCPLFRE